MDTMMIEAVPNTFVDLFWGYSVMWLCILVYLFSIIKRIRNVEDRLRELNS